MTTEHPITPPPELVEQWLVDAPPKTVDTYVTTQAARWGADQELEACKQVIMKQQWFAAPGFRLDQLHNARRPKPPSLKEQALKELKDWTDEKHGLGGEAFVCEGLSVAIIRRALESLPD